MRNANDLNRLKASQKEQRDVEAAIGCGFLGALGLYLTIVVVVLWALIRLVLHFT